MLARELRPIDAAFTPIENFLAPVVIDPNASRIRFLSSGMPPFLSGSSRKGLISKTAIRIGGHYEYVDFLPSPSDPFHLFRLLKNIWTLLQ